MLGAWSPRCLVAQVQPGKRQNTLAVLFYTGQQLRKARVLTPGYSTRNRTGLGNPKAKPKNFPCSQPGLQSRTKGSGWWECPNNLAPHPLSPPPLPHTTRILLYSHHSPAGGLFRNGGHSPCQSQCCPLWIFTDDYSTETFPPDSVCQAPGSWGWAAGRNRVDVCPLSILWSDPMALDIQGSFSCITLLILLLAQPTPPATDSLPWPVTYLEVSCSVPPEVCGCQVSVMCCPDSLWVLQTALTFF